MRVNKGRLAEDSLTSMVNTMDINIFLCQHTVMAAALSFSRQVRIHPTFICHPARLQQCQNHPAIWPAVRKWTTCYSKCKQTAMPWGAVRAPEPKWSDEGARTKRPRHGTSREAFHSGTVPHCPRKQTERNECNAICAVTEWLMESRRTILNMLFRGVGCGDEKIRDST